MHDDHLELLRHMFSIVTEMLETAHEEATRAQAREVSPAEHLDSVETVRLIAQKVLGLSDAISIVAAELERPAEVPE